MSVEDASDVVFEEENLRFLQLGRISEHTVHAAAQREPHAVISLAHLVQGRLAGQAQDDHCSSGVLWQNHCVAVAPMNVLLLATANQLVRLPLAETLAAAQQYQKPETLREAPFPKLDVVQLQRLGTQTVIKSEPIDVATFGAILDLQVSADGAAVAVNTNAGRSLIYAMADLRLVFTLPSTYDRLWCWIPRTPSSVIVTRKIDRSSAFVLDAAETQALTLVAAGDVLLSIVFSNHEWLCLRFALRRSLETPNIVTAIEKLDQISLQTPGRLRQVCRLQPLSESESLIAFTEAESLTVPPDAVQFALVRLPPVHTSQQSVSSTSQVTCFRAPHWIILGEVCPIFMDAADDLSRWISYLVAVPEWRLCVCALAPSDELELVGDSHWGQSSPAWRILRISDDFRAQLPEFDNSEWVRILGMDCFYDCPEESADKIAAFEPVLVVFTNNGLLHWLRIRGRASAGRAHDQQRVLNRAPIPELVTDLVHGNPATPTSLALDTEHPQKSSSDVFMEHAPPRVDMSLSEATSAADGRRFDRVSLDGSVVERPQANAMIPDRDCNQQSVLSAGMERVEVGASTKIADATTFSASYTPASPASARLRSPATNPSPEVERSLPDLRAVLRIGAAENERSQDQQDNDDTG
ncbi:hypothetical protein F1559_004826 [Cyanidiococcus yangmingshanensis]|uniref:Uncharacterized protein n=1 Tax=Cyanidiococcus yangmingshanensis TaxID=2690220 RepID=A0A7J7IQJ3_9RHOD|nr:hypothetical protein F1559_004826 [Cyanidiococcus yangmingshanensis]